VAFIEDSPDAETSADNQTRLFAHRPAVREAWEQLKAAVTESMDTRRYELVTLAAARRLRSTYCMLAHGRLLAEQFLDPEVVRVLARDYRSVGLDAVDAAVMDLAVKVVDDATS
jgi:alkylhydroperoxidase family enzyme